jgi:hypothetical protein
MLVGVGRLDVMQRTMLASQSQVTLRGRSASVSRKTTFFDFRFVPFVVRICHLFKSRLQQRIVAERGIISAGTHRRYHWRTGHFYQHPNE